MFVEVKGPVSMANCAEFRSAGHSTLQRFLWHVWSENCMQRFKPFLSINTGRKHFNVWCISSIFCHYVSVAMISSNSEVLTDKTRRRPRSSRHVLPWLQFYFWKVTRYNQPLSWTLMVVWNLLFLVLYNAIQKCFAKTKSAANFVTSISLIFI